MEIIPLQSNGGVLRTYHVCSINPLLDVLFSTIDGDEVVSANNQRKRGS